MRFAEFWDALEGVQSHIRAFDTKAQIAIGLNAGLIGLLIAELTKVADDYPLGFAWRFGAILLLAFLSLGLALIAVVLGVRVVHPQLKLNQPYSRFFFCHLAERHGRDFAAAASELRSTSDDESEAELTSQIAVNSYVCNVKAKRFRPVLGLTALAFGLYAISIVPFVSLNLAAAKLGPHQAATTPSLSNGAIANVVASALPHSLSTPVAMIIGALLALAGAVIGVVVTRVNAKEQNGLAARMKLADFREAWIHRFREAAAELFGQLNTPQSKESAARVKELAAKVRLMMNRKDGRYSRLVQLLEAVQDSAGTDAKMVAGDLETCIQDILKEEWGVLKRDLKYAPPDIKD